MENGRGKARYFSEWVHSYARTTQGSEKVMNACTLMTSQTSHIQLFPLLEVIPGEGAVQTFSLQPSPPPCSLHLLETRVFPVWGKNGLIQSFHYQGDSHQGLETEKQAGVGTSPSLRSQGAHWTKS